MLADRDPEDFESLHTFISSPLLHHKSARSLNSASCSFLSPSRAVLHVFADSVASLGEVWVTRLGRQKKKPQ